MDEIIQLFRKLKKSKSVQNGLDLDLTSPSSSNTETENTNSNGPHADLQKAKFKLKRPRLTSPTEKRILQQKNKNKKHQHSRTSLRIEEEDERFSVKSECQQNSGNNNKPFADEDDLFADRDDGVYMQSASSASSASPAASERLGSVGLPASSEGLPKLHGSRRLNPGGRPASCTFGAASEPEDARRLFQPRTTFQTSPAASVLQSRGGRSSPQVTKGLGMPNSIHIFASDRKTHHILLSRPNIC